MILGRSIGSAPYCSYESLRQVRFSPCTFSASTARIWCCWIACDEKDDGLLWHCRLLHVLLRAHPHQRQLYESDICSLESYLRLLDTRFVAANTFHKAAIPGIYRSSRADEDAEHGKLGILHWSHVSMHKQRSPE